ncbi:redoxin domain-containing protein [bacterium]|nr:redoxin domain-containing protein [bacterium]
MAVRAPAFARELEWFNTEPLLLSELKGRYLLLDFFTFGCINCLNNLRTIKSLHTLYGKELCVIGVHTGKFTREKEPSALQQALYRHGIEFAVVNDPAHLMADAYTAKGWPTTILIDERGYIVEQTNGEQKVEEWKRILGSFGLETCRGASSNRGVKRGLLFPQKVLAADTFLAVANTGNGDVWLSDYDGAVSTVIEELQAPMGMAFADNKLYICESEAGQVISFDMVTKEKCTVIEGLCNPYDIAVNDDNLVVALAGSHQIALYKRSDLTLLQSYGNGFEALRDGRAEVCQLAQPSGLSIMDGAVWFVDAESSSLRKIESAEVSTSIGEGLFTFGDSNEGEMLLQHPQGVCAGIIGDGCGGGRLFIADTFNNKVKAYFPDDNSMMTLLEGLNEPGGISKKGCELYIANTNAHEIVVFDLSKMQNRVMAFDLTKASQ